MPTLTFQNRSIDLADADLATVKEALDAFVRGVSMDTYLSKVPPAVSEFVNQTVKDLSMQAFGGGSPAGYTHRWRGAVKDFLQTLG